MVRLARDSDRKREQSPEEDNQTKREVPLPKDSWSDCYCNHCVLDTGFVIRNVWCDAHFPISHIVITPHT